MRGKQIATPHGPARVARLHTVADPVATLLLTHGAGGGIDAIDLQALAARLPEHGFEVRLIEMPWRVAGKKVASRPAVLDECFRAVHAALKLSGPVVIGGRSAGARVACRLATPLAVDGVLALAFPLHPPGRPESSRLAELRLATCPRLVVQGERDTFGGPGEFPPDTKPVPVPFADHSLKVPQRAPVTQEATLDLIVDAVLSWLGTAIG
ncbi:MAG: alpha/beta hydrolase family protein [Marmoricola sp.]